MNKFPFNVNGIDFSDLVHKYGYTTYRTHVFTDAVRTLDGKDHYSLLRTKGGLKTRLNPAEKSRLQALAEELENLPATVRYYSFQSGTVVTEKMMTVGMPLSLLLSTGGKDWLGGVELTFDEM